MLIAFGTSIFAAAALLFAVQPLMSKLLLPMFGGSALVWAAALVFFQAGLLAGYAYAHASGRWLTQRSQWRLHIAVVLVPILTLPLAVKAENLASSAPPSVAVVSILALSVGLPYIALASTSPLLQHWFSRTTHPDAADPYFLYAAGNAGSLIGLLAYPFIFEPLMTVETQRWLWSAAYVVFAAVTITSGLRALRNQRDTEDSSRERQAISVPDSSRAATGGALARPTAGGIDQQHLGLESPGDSLGQPPSSGRRRKARWVVLAFVPAAMLTAVTTYVTSDIAAVPMLWVVPLALYLVAFIVAYSRRRVVSPGVSGTVLAILAVAVVLTSLDVVTLPLWGVLALQYGMFFAAALLTATLLADDRPSTDSLTVYYLLIALGGVLGGAFSGLVAPLLFNSTLEYPIGLLMAICLIPPWRSPRGGTVRDITVGLALLLGLLGLLSMLSLLDVEPDVLVLALAGWAIASLVLRKRPVRMAFALGGAFAATLLATPTILYSERTFYGIHRVIEETDRHLYVSGTTLHGAQMTTEVGSQRPLTYYHQEGPVGDIFSMLRTREEPIGSIGVVGLGAGGLAAYAEAGEQWRFFEIDPEVVRIATTDSLFTFLADAPASVETHVGDGRLSLLAEGPDAFDVLIMDAFTGDAVPAHLLTKEAVAGYLEKLKTGGMLVFNTSNRYVDVNRVVAGAARELGLAGRLRRDPADKEGGRSAARSPSEWIALAKDADDLASLTEDQNWVDLETIDPVVWTDEYSNLASVLRWG